VIVVTGATGVVGGMVARELTGRLPISIRGLIEQYRDELPFARKERT